MSQFPCTGCGACCRRINLAVSYHNVTDKTDPLYFPHRWDDTGRCEMLDSNNRCKVYLKRPLICDIKRYANYMEHDEKEFFDLNIWACNKLMDEDGLSLDLRIK